MTKTTEDWERLKELIQQSIRPVGALDSTGLRIIKYYFTDLLLQQQTLQRSQSEELITDLARASILFPNNPLADKVFTEIITKWKQRLEDKV